MLRKWKRKDDEQEKKETIFGDRHREKENEEERRQEKRGKKHWRTAIKERKLKELSKRKKIIYRNYNREWNTTRLETKNINRKNKEIKNEYERKRESDCKRGTKINQRKQAHDFKCMKIDWPANQPPARQLDRWMNR